jgi:hypothetical protein
MFLNPPIKYHYLPRSLAWLVLAAGASRSSAQSDYLEQSLPDLTMPHLKYVELNVEAEQSGASGGGSQTTYQRLYVAPTVGICLAELRLAPIHEPGKRFFAQRRHPRLFAAAQALRLHRFCHGKP